VGDLTGLTQRSRDRARRQVARVAQWVATTSYLQRWLVLGSAIGLIAGAGAVVFYSLLVACTHLFLTDLVGFQVPTPIGEGGLPGSTTMARPWALPLVVGLGGLLSSLLVFGLAPETEGHGTDAAIKAVNENPRGLRARAPLVKIVSSALTIGSGGSGGREGPTAQISAGFGSLVSRLLNLSPADARIAVAAGIGSGIGAIFKAPLGGAVLATEILYRDDMEPEALLPALIASVVSYAVFGAVEGFTPMFGYGGGYHFHDPRELVWFALIGVLAGLTGLLYAKGFYGIADGWKRLPTPRVLKPAIGAVMVGLIGIALPEVLGTGYGWVQESFARQQLLQLPLLIVIALPFARIVATGFSIGSGGSGGIFGPGMVIGAFMGAAVWRLLEPIAPAVPSSPAPFVIIGMMACFGSIARAPLAIMLMVAEMTGSLQLLAPAMLAVGIATLIVRRSDSTIYRSQSRTRLDSPAHRLQVGMPLLSGVRTAEVMQPPTLLLHPDVSVDSARRQLETHHVPGAPLVGADAQFAGVVSAAALDGADPGAPVAAVNDPTWGAVQQAAALDVALESLGEVPDQWAPVLDTGQRVVGIVTVGDVVRGYRHALASSLGLMSRLTGRTTVVEATVASHSPAASRPLRDADLPPGTIVVTVERRGGLLFPDAATTLEPGDVVSALARAQGAGELRRLLEGTAESSPP
jgi:H+/Cl- antiporter ClcA